MNADITLNTIAFKKSFDSSNGSERRSSARGVNTPDILSIRRQDATDSKTKTAQKRYNLRIDRTDETTEGVKYTTSAYAVIVIPEQASQAQIDNVIATFRAAVAASSPEDIVVGMLNGE